MYKILIVCTNTSIIDEISYFICGNHRIIISAQTIEQAIKIKNSLKINFFIIVSTESNMDLFIIQKLKNDNFYKFTPIAYINYSSTINNDLDDMFFYQIIKPPLNKASFKEVNCIINHDLNILLSKSDFPGSFIILNNSSGFIRIKIQLILFFEAYGHGCTLYTLDGNYSIPFTLKEIEKYIHSTPLYRCHRSYIINTKNILNINKDSPTWEISFYGCEKVAFVSRQNKKELSDIIKKNYTIDTYI